MSIQDFILGYTAGQGQGGSDPVLEPVTATPSTTQQVITPPEGADGISQATVSAVTKELLAQLDADFVAWNIKQGVDILGLVGTFAGGGESYKEWTLTPTSQTAEATIVSGDSFLSSNYNNDNLYVIIKRKTIDGKNGLYFCVSGMKEFAVAGSSSFTPHSVKRPYTMAIGSRNVEGREYYYAEGLKTNGIVRMTSDGDLIYNVNDISDSYEYGHIVLANVMYEIRAILL